MRYVIEPEGGYFHWIVKCVEKGKVVELHRFYQSGDKKYIYHRGEHGPHENEAREVIVRYLKEHPEAAAGVHKSLVTARPILNKPSGKSAHTLSSAEGGRNAGGAPDSSRLAWFDLNE